MKAVDFDYERPATIADLVRRLAEAGEDAKIIAGGQTLVPLLAMRLARPSLLLDINRIGDLAGIEADDESVTIRACTRQADALASEVVRTRLPLLAKALAFVGHGQTRNRGTVGGSLANADPAAEIGLTALTLGAEIAARSATGDRVIPIAEFFQGPMETALRPDEVLTQVRFPAKRDWKIGTGFQETSVRQSDFALAAAAVQAGFDTRGLVRSIVISVGGAGTTPLRIHAAEMVVRGSPLDDAAIKEAGKMTRASVKPLADPHASPRYRARVAAALVERALAEARDEAKAT